MRTRIGSILITIICLQASLYAEEVCEFNFNWCPKDFNGDTITLPEQVVALSSSILACSDSLQYSVADSSPPPSIMFVIDHSPSMAGTNITNPNDQDGVRFSVTREFIDSIYAKQPKAEVGLVVFAGRLIFDSTTSEYYTKYFKTLPEVKDTLTPHQAYVKMLTLNSLYSGKKGIDILKDILTTKDSTYRRTTFTDLTYQPITPRSGTDINLAFYAARDAMKTAKNPPERQFVIFFSDGEPNGTILPDSINNFKYGINVPTTFTVYFTSSTTAPQSIQQMTSNIQMNNYSQTNPNSNLWAIRANHDTLLDLLINNAMKNMVIHGNPNHMIINGVTSVGTTDTSFEFPKNFALTGNITPFTAEIKYQYKNPDNSTIDTSVNLKFVVKRTTTASLPSGIGTKCWEQPTLQFYYNNSPISEATEDMQQLQIRLTPNEEIVINPKVDLKSSLETMTVTLSSFNSGVYWGKTFQRAANTKAINDNILQNIEGDSIIAVYRNPDLPLDSIRVAIPVRVRPKPIPVTAILRDTSADGHFDRIDLTWTTDTIDIIKTLPSASEFVSNAQITTTDGVIKLNPGAVVKRNGDTLSIILTESTGKNRETGWISADIKLTDAVVTVSGNAFTVEKILDGAGPVIDRAIYYPGNESQHDTLKVLLSEAVNCANLNTGLPMEAFKYIDGGKQNQSMLQGASYLFNCESGFVTEIKMLLTSNGLVIPGEDSMNLFGNNTYVVDNNNNRPPSNNRPIPVEWGTNNLVTAGVANNPSVIGKTDIDPRVRQHYGIKETKGVVIGITSKVPFKNQGNGSYGFAVVYDAVGNLIMDKISIKKSESGNDYFIYWDWKNRYNRVVGAGTYLFILSSQTTDQKGYSKKIKIGLINGQ